MSLTRISNLQCQAAVGRVEVLLCVRSAAAVAGLVRLIAIVGPMDFDDPSPTITIMMPHEAGRLRTPIHGVRQNTLTMILNEAYG